jgi:cell division protein FtsW
MSGVSRADTSLIGRWWWTVDRWTLAALGALLFAGFVLVLAGSPAVAERLNQARTLFISKQIAFLAFAAFLLLAVSVLSPANIRRLALLGCAGALLATAATLVIGEARNGSRRWIALPGMSLQPSEFLKPCFAVAAAWLMAEARRRARFPGTWMAILLFAAIAVLLKSQPDIGMLVVLGATFFAQLFLAGLNVLIVCIGVAAIVGLLVLAYVMFPHVQSRVHRFLDPSSGDTYQVDRALQAFGNGGLLGAGPGEGRVKDVLPDAHTDFIFAVAGEEFGLLACLLLLALFAFVVVRGLLRLLAEHDMFVVLAAAGLLVSFGLQAFVNMATALHLIPTKGMTLPFVSYGGSSALSVALGMGMLLALTRRRHHADLP